MEKNTKYKSETRKLKYRIEPIQNSKFKIQNSTKRGAAVITAVLFFVLITTTIALGLSGPVVREYKNVRDFERSKGAHYLAESGMEDVLYRIKNARLHDVQEVLVLGGHIATTTVATISSVSPVRKTVSSIADINGIIRKVSSIITTSSGASFTVGVQVGNGGFQLDGSSSVTGNVYAGGPIVGSNSRNDISGSVVSAGPSGSVVKINSGAGSPIYANTITDSRVGGNAYYQSISGTTVTGTSFPGSANLATVAMPISEEMIDQWEADAATGGSFTDPCIITTPTTWETRKITCEELEIKDTLTLKGMLWVVGNLRIKGGTVILHPTLGSQSAGIIVDNPANRTTSSKIILETSTNFQGSGATGSYVMLLSRNNSAKLGGSEIAIDLGQSATGAIFLYSNEGAVVVGQSSALKEVTAYKVYLQNSANVTYESGMTSVVFVGVPTGAWVVEDWKPIP